MTSLKIWCFISIVFLVTLETHAASIKQQSPSKPERKLDFDRFHEVDVFSWGTWYQGRTIGRIIKKRTVLIKYIGYNSRSNVWLPENSDRLAPRGTHVQWKGDELDLSLNAELDVFFSWWRRGRVIDRNWEKYEVQVLNIDQPGSDNFNWINDISHRLAPRGTHVKWRDDKLVLGGHLPALDVRVNGKWFRGVVRGRNFVKFQVTIQNISNVSKYEYRLPDTSDRLAPKGTHVKWERDDDLDLSLDAELDVSSKGKWHRGRVIDIYQLEYSVQIHLIGCLTYFWLPDISDQLAPKGTRVKWERDDDLDLTLNAELDVLSKGKWYRGRVIDINQEERKVKIHYISKDSKYDDWLPDISDKLARKGTHVKWEAAATKTSVKQKSLSKSDATKISAKSNSSPKSAVMTKAGAVAKPA
eukprot:804473_1